MISASVFPSYYEDFNEDGPFTAVCYQASITNARGHRWVHKHTFKQEDAVVDLVNKINAHIRRTPDWIPSEEYWIPSFPVYGSEAYIVEGTEHELAKVDIEAEFGPGSYRPGGPGYLERL